jgi:hypothetical protein
MFLGGTLLIDAVVRIGMVGVPPLTHDRAETYCLQVRYL